jgi:iron complex outermembrane receptor protein
MVAYEGSLGRISFDTQYDVVRARSTEGDEDPLVRITPQRILGGVNYSFHERFDARFEVFRVFDQDRIADFETTTDGYTLVNARFALSPFDAVPGLEFGLSATNLTNELGRVHTSFLKDIAPVQGRDVRFSLRIAT